MNLFEPLPCRCMTCREVRSGSEDSWEDGVGPSSFDNSRYAELAWAVTDMGLTAPELGHVSVLSNGVLQMTNFFAVMEATRHCYAILDTGATTSLCGKGCFEKLQKFVGQKIEVDTSVWKKFKFCNAQIDTSFGVAKFHWWWHGYSRTVDVH